MTMVELVLADSWNLGWEGRINCESIGLHAVARMWPYGCLSSLAVYMPFSPVAVLTPVLTQHTSQHTNSTPRNTQQTNHTPKYVKELQSISLKQKKEISRTKVWPNKNKTAMWLCCAGCAGCGCDWVCWLSPAISFGQKSEFQKRSTQEFRKTLKFWSPGRHSQQFRMSGIQECMFSHSGILTFLGIQTLRNAWNSDFGCLIK